MSKNLPSLLLLFLIGVFTTAAALADERDGKTYRTVKIGEQVWMAENLNYETEGSLCYENKPENCAKYGRLYDGKSATKVCPKGWHLQTFDEWRKHFNAKDDLGEKDKYVVNFLKSGFGYGFKHKRREEIQFSSGGSLWCLNQHYAIVATCWCMGYPYEGPGPSGYQMENDMFSIRCLRD